MNDSEMIDEMADCIEKLERQVMLLKAATDHDAVAIGKLRERIEKLEAALETWLVAVNYDDVATPLMNEMGAG